MEIREIQGNAVWFIMTFDEMLMLHGLVLREMERINARDLNSPTWGTIDSSTLRILNDRFKAVLKNVSKPRVA